MSPRNEAYAPDRPMFPVGVNVFVVRDQKLLLGKRKGGMRGDGEWGLPGGHLEESEHMVDCAARELLEETGLRARHFRFVIADNDHRDQSFHFVHFGFLAEDVGGEPQLLEPDRCTEWAWFALDGLPEPLFVGHRKLIEGYIAGENFVE